MSLFWFNGHKWEYAPDVEALFEYERWIDRLFERACIDAGLDPFPELRNLELIPLIANE